jgi:hypothetical protein
MGTFLKRIIPFTFALGTVLFFFTGCSHRPVPVKPVFVIFKTPVLKLAGTGFLKKGEDKVDLEMYESGAVLGRLLVNLDQVCFADRCMTGKEFTRRFLRGAYEDDLLYHILRGEPIFGGQNLTNTPKGFSQRIKTKRLDIIYEVKPGQVYFKDRAAGILIKLKELDG